MKKNLLSLLLLLLFITPNFVFAAGSIKVSTYNITMTEGSSSTFKITATNAAGKVDIASSNTSVATVSSAGFWIENQTNTVTVNGKSVGSTTIKVVLADAATFDSEELTGSYTINVTVKAKANNSGSNNSGGSTNQNNSNVESKSSDNTLKNIIIDGYKLDFKSNVTSYNLDVENKVTSLNIKAEVNHSKATAKVNNVELKEGNNKIEIIVTAENGSKKTYTINVNRKVDSDTVVVSDLEDVLENTKHDKIYVIVNNDEVISKNILEKIKDSDIEVYVRKVDNDKILYEWEVSKNGIIGDLNPIIDFSNNIEIDKNSNYTKGIHFKLSDNILSNNRIKIYVGNNYSDGEKLYLYDEKLKSIGDYKVEDGYVEVDVKNAGGYLITNVIFNDEFNVFMIVSLVEVLIIGYLLVDKFVLTKKKKRKK